MWRTVFTQPADDKTALSDWGVAQCLGAVRVEMARIRAALQALDKDPNSYEPFFSSVTELTQIERLGRSWGEVQPLYNDNARAGLQLLGEFMPSDFEILRDEEVKEISDLIATWREEVKAAHDLPFPVRSMLKEQLDILACGLYSSRMRGAEAFEEARAASVMAWHRYESAWRPYETHDVVRNIQRAWSKVVAVSKDVIIVGTAFSQVFGIGQLLLGIDQPLALPPGPVEQSAPAPDGSPEGSSESSLGSTQSQT